MKQLNKCISYLLKYSLPALGRCLWRLRASSPSPPLVPPPSLHNRLLLPPPSLHLTCRPPSTPSPTPPHFLSLHPWHGCSAVETLRRPPLRVKPVMARTEPAAHPKTWRTLWWDLRGEQTPPTPPPHPSLLLPCFRLWMMLGGTAAAIGQRCKLRGGRQQTRPGKGAGQVGFGAAERTGRPELMGLKVTTHRTGKCRAVLKFRR